MELVVVIILALVAAILAIMLFVVLQRSQASKQNPGVELLKAEVTELNRTITTLQTTLGDKLERNASTMQLSLQKQLGESMKLVGDVSQRLAKLDETNRRVVDVADELKTLQNVLQNPKQRGVFGEYYLESVLANILPTKNFKMQYGFKDGVIADAVVIWIKDNLYQLIVNLALKIIIVWWRRQQSPNEKIG